MISAPPRPPRADRAALEALIEEARRRARRRRLGYAALVAAAVAAAALVGFTGLRTAAAPKADASSRPLAQVVAERDGKLAFQSRLGAMELIDPDGSGSVTFDPCRPPSCNADDPAWSPDGSRIAFLVARGGSGHSSPTQYLYVADAAGRAQRSLARCGTCGTQWGAHLGWSRDGRSIIFSRDAGPRGQQSLWIVATTGGTPRRLTNCGRSYCVDPVWSPDGRRIVFTRGDGNGPSWLFTIRPDGSGLARIALGADPQWSPDGRQVVYDGLQGIAVTDAQGSSPRLLLAQRTGYGPGVPSWSPDGAKIAFFNTPGTPGHFRAEVWTMNADGSAPTRLYRSGCCVSVWAAPVWSPDGRLLAFAASSAPGVFVMRADGTGLRRLSRAYPGVLAWQTLPGR